MVSALEYSSEIITKFDLIAISIDFKFETEVAFAVYYQLSLIMFETSMFIWINYLLYRYHHREFHKNKVSMMM